MNKQRYLQRIGLADPMSPDVDTLCLLQRSHLLTVPFENLDIHWKRPIVLDQSKLPEPRSHAAPAHAQGAGDGGEARGLAPGGGEVGIVEGGGGPSSLPQASPGGKRPGASPFVDLAGGAEGAEAASESARSSSVERYQFYVRGDRASGASAVAWASRSARARRPCHGVAPFLRSRPSWNS